VFIQSQLFKILNLTLAKRNVLGEPQDTQR